jgi:LemA protein
MTYTLLFWLTLAVLLFWALGAYNRLVRLRAQAIGAFTAVDHRLMQVLTLVSERAAVQRAQPAAPDADADAGLDGLRGAAIQFEVALRVARKAPLDAPSMAALRTACATVQVSWERSQAQPDEALTANQRAWEDNQQARNEALESFNQAVAVYNRAIAQFPAVVLAYFFGLRAAENL